jgi:hypothetical protein
MEKRGGALIDIDKTALEKRMRIYYAPEVTWEGLKALGMGLTKDAAGFDAKAVRAKVQAAEEFQPARIRRYALRPFETRWCYYSDVSPLWNRSRPTLWAQSWEGNEFLLTRFKCAKDPEGPPYFFTTSLSDDHFLTPDAVAIPIRLHSPVARNDKDKAAQNHLFADTESSPVTPTANLSLPAVDYLASVGIANPDADTKTASLIWMHALAIGYSPAYLRENADGIRQDWPRVPLPDTKEALEASSQLGRQVAALLDTERTVKGVTSGSIRPELKTIAVVSRVGGGTLNPDAGDLALTSGWGHAGKGGITMPGKGKVSERAYTPAELEAIAAGLEALGLSTEQALAHLGETTFDIYLNDVACWRNIPGRVWDYTIGGYQVIKKWLSYRERELLGRALTPDEAREVMNIARRIVAILLLEPALNTNYEQVKRSCYAWPPQ